MQERSEDGDDCYLCRLARTQAQEVGLTWLKCYLGSMKALSKRRGSLQVFVGEVELFLSKHRIIY